MMDQNAAPLGDIDMSEIGAALASAGGAAPAGGGAPSGGMGAAGGAGHAPRPSGGGAVQSLDFILDIPLKVTAELGRSKMAIREILQLAQGSVIELSKFAGEPLEVLVNDKLIARGEVVVVNEKFGVRLTDIISPVERIEQLK
jgi:flagellar motor switch protein FliN/FliY